MVSPCTSWLTFCILVLAAVQAYDFKLADASDRADRRTRG
jgi:hypothetical protein